MIKLDMYKSCCFTGHRPQRLYGYDLSNNKYQVLAHKLAKIAYTLYTKYDVDTFFTGGALGADTIAFFAIEYVKSKGIPVKNYVVVPFCGQEKRWNAESIDRYNRMLKASDGVIYIDQIFGLFPNKNYRVADVLDRRNRYMVDNSKYIVTVFDGVRKGGTYNCINYAMNRYGDDKLIIDAGI